MRNYGEHIGETAVKFVRDLPGPITRVWEYLTEPDKRKLWLAGGKTDAEAGGDVQYDFDNLSLTPHEEIVPDKYKKPDTEDQTVSFAGKILVYDKPNTLKVTWPDSAGGDSTVTFDLREAGDRVVLTVLHERIPKKDELISASAGWHVHLDILESKLDGQVPDPFWENHTQAEAEYRDQLHKNG